MAKRFTDSAKWKDAWFMDLPSKYKLFWFYILDECDHAGVWKVNFRLATAMVGESFEASECKRQFKDRITFLDDENWYINKFIKFQYKVDYQQLNPKNNVHKSVIDRLENFGIIEGLPSPSLGAKDKDKDKDKDLEKEKDKDIQIVIFENFRTAYQGTKGGKEKEFQNFIKKTKDWKEVLPLLMPALQREISYKQALIENKKFCPEWKNLQTWINQRCWEQEFAPIIAAPKKDKRAFVS